VSVFWHISPETVIRPEPKAALWFHRRTAELLELDPEGLQTLVQALENPKGLSWRARVFVHYLHCRGFLSPSPQTHSDSIKQIQNCLALSEQISTPLRSLSAPEALHISLTDRCDQRCAGCFFSNPGVQTPNRYLDLAIYTKIIAQAAQYKVFQIALGGGEPFLHPQLLKMVANATASGLVASMTSNGNHLTTELAKGLKQAGLGQLQFSLNGLKESTHAQTRPNHEKVFQAIQTCKSTDLRWGLNVLVTRQNISELEDLLKFAQRQGAWSVNLLRPKPALQGGKWLNYSLPQAEENRALQKLLKRWQRRSRFLLTTDSSFSFLRQGSLKQWQTAGVQGCSAGRQILSVNVDGTISPCSHIPLVDHCEAGDFMRVWQKSQHLQRFRELEETLQGQCQSCELKTVCRGCRAIVLQETGIFEGADLGCPKHQPISS
jgi:radical SAM protein with 4Fe4S-binding SPASM domain